MLRKIIATLCLIVSTTPVWALCSGDSFLAQLTPVEQSRLTVLRGDIPNGAALFWTATRGDDTVTLIGTLHIHDPRLADIMVQVGDLITTADLLLVEATPAEEAKMQTALTADPTRLFLPEGHTLPALVGDATWNQLIAAARARGIPPFLLSKFQPWYVMMTLSVPPCALDDLAAGKRGLDHMIMAQAATAGVPAQALEPFDTLFDVFKTGTLDDQITMLKLTADIEQDQQAMLVSLLDDYFAARIDQVFALNQIAAERALGITAAAPLVQKTDQTLLFDRNIAWLPVITAATDAHDDIIVAAGAAHLAGTQGLVALMRADGWTVTAR